MVSLGEVNSRYKDFYDVWFLAQHFDIPGPTLARALRATFNRRGTELRADPLPLTAGFASEPARQAQWRAFVRRSGAIGAPEQFTEVVALVRALLAPIAAAPTPETAH